MVPGVSLVQGIEEVADLGGFPYERALDFRDGDFTGLHPSQDGLDRVWGDGIALGHSWIGYDGEIFGHYRFAAALFVEFNDFNYVVGIGVSVLPWPSGMWRE